MKDLSLVLRKVQTVVDTLREAAIAPRVARSIGGRLEGGTTSYDFAVYFADSDKLLYQLQAWISTLEQLPTAGMNVVLVVKSPSVARALAAQSHLPILLTRSMAAIETFVAAHGVAGIFYVNNSQANFTALRMTGPAHIHLNHGESEKSSMVSNQLKAYDYAFIAGDAAEERILAHIKRVQRSSLIKIGRPQLDLLESPEASSILGARSTVLYAPTWEGDTKDMAYSSIATVGMRFVREVLSDGRFTLVFRPHPKTGSWSRDAARALKNIKTQIKAADANDPTAGHRLDDVADPAASIGRSDIVVSDVSAMAMDAIGLNHRILLLDNFEVPRKHTDKDPAQTMAQCVPSVSKDYKGNFAQLLAGVIGSRIPADQERFRRHVFGDPALGTGTGRFVEACGDIKNNLLKGLS